MIRFARAISVLFMLVSAGSPLHAAGADARAIDVLENWNRLVLELVRHTPTYSPPVASRAFAYLGVAAYEATASGRKGMRSLAGQLNSLSRLPSREPDAAYDDAVVIQAAMAAAAKHLFSNTGPTGQRAMGAMEKQAAERAADGVAPDVVARSTDFGDRIAAHVIEWSASDGGAVVENMGFPLEYQPVKHPAHWTPTSLIAQQQVPLLPGWGGNRSFAMPDGAACPLPPPPAYSEEEGSDFRREAEEVRVAVRDLTEDQRAIARFWSDDPMLSPTPPGHWMSIALQVLDEEGADLEKRVDLLARLGVALADSFIACWHEKYAFDLVRPVTYIRRVIDPDWEPILNTPPFPEYPSGHSTQSGAAAKVLEAAFGNSYSFEDNTHEADGLASRRYDSFWAAAEEAALSRLYGGIHFRAAIERGLDQGRCVGAYATKLVTRE
ncbi:MAG: vanadium-dependent haloperoxidase [Rhizobiaceae bacterium]|nr:vanadium-dependent haloperoxidase [Rhizobiaceae bacterium]MCV0409044.1 vanadium-dependent haloperoxidase [Rhizobiaceae bacterium]